MPLDIFDLLRNEGHAHLLASTGTVPAPVPVVLVTYIMQNQCRASATVTSQPQASSFIRKAGIRLLEQMQAQNSPLLREVF